MYVLASIAIKSILVAALTFGVLRLLKKRSAAERSCIAHVGLLALVLLAVAAIILPSWTIETSVLPGQNPVAERGEATAGGVLSSPAELAAPRIGTAAVRPVVSTSAAVTAFYAIPSAGLLFITLLALGRLGSLRARAEVLVDGHWVSALARAQRRMGFKQGTALLVSNDLASPVSWGLLRPVILLNSRAVEALDEAEAIIAHELAHVAQLDWAKLLLARIATALFWFNPLVWMLAREAHQLREESADDAVLAANIASTDYAELLIATARHESRGLLLGAHGVAPSKHSLARRIKRILDGRIERSPVAEGSVAIALAGAILIVAPLAALTLAPEKGPRKTEAAPSTAAWTAHAPARHGENHVLPAHSTNGRGQHVRIAANERARDTQTSADDIPQADGLTALPAGTIVARSPNGATTIRYPQDANGDRKTVSYSPNGANTTIYPPDSTGKRKVVSRSPNGATTTSYEDVGH